MIDKEQAQWRQHYQNCDRCGSEVKRAGSETKLNDMELCRHGRRMLIKFDPRIKALLPNKGK